MRTYLIMDFDSTFVRVEALDELAWIVLRGAPDREKRAAQIAGITKEGMEGKIGFGESLARRLALFQPDQNHINDLVSLLRTQVTPSVAANQAFFQENAASIYIISGGFREFIVPVAQDFGIAPEHILANTFVRDAHGAVTGCDRNNPLAHDNGKVKQLAKLALSGRTIMVGDGFSDYLARKAGVVDEFVAFTENVEREPVTEHADLVARNFKDVMGLYRNAGEQAPTTIS